MLRNVYLLYIYIYIDTEEVAEAVGVVKYEISQVVRSHRIELYYGHTLGLYRRPVMPMSIIYPLNYLQTHTHKYLVKQNPTEKSGGSEYTEESKRPNMICDLSRGIMGKELFLSSFARACPFMHRIIADNSGGHSGWETILEKECGSQKRERETERIGGH